MCKAECVTDLGEMCKVECVTALGEMCKEKCVNALGEIAQCYTHMQIWMFKRCGTSDNFDVGYMVLRDLILHRFSINNSALSAAYGSLWTNAYIIFRIFLRQELFEYMDVHNNDASESSKPSWGKSILCCYQVNFQRKVVYTTSLSMICEAAPKPKASARKKKGDSASSTTPPNLTPTTTVVSAPRLSATAKGVLDVPSDDSEEELSWNSFDDEEVVKVKERVMKKKQDKRKRKVLIQFPEHRKKVRMKAMMRRIRN
nr:hypothetical protein [Tanacetum cinerariifolium]